MNIIKKYEIKNIDCANCALKVEESINKLDYIETATLNFSTSTLKIEFKSSENIDISVLDVKKLIKNLEPQSSILEINKSNNLSKISFENNFNLKNKELIRIIFCIVVYFIGILMRANFLVSSIIFAITYILIGYDVIFDALKNIVKGKIFDENFLMFIATIGAFAIGDFAEGVAVMLFFQVGEYFQHLAVNKSRKSISELMDIKPDYANLKKENIVSKISPEKVNIGDTIVIKSGEKIPLDGIIICGASMIDSKALTGESIPKDVVIGDNVLSGSINLTGLLEIEVTETFDNSTVVKILNMVENASSKKSVTEQFITKFARIYTPIVLILACLIIFLPMIFIQNAIFSHWLYKSLVFLVISCPCALVISIPLSFFGGIGCASKNGILVKGSNYLDALNYIDTVVFDKTGTLTNGVFDVSIINATSDVSKDELIKYAAYAEYFSNHPIGKSIVKKYSANIDGSKIKNYTELSGHGVSVNVDNEKILAGNSKLMKENNINNFIEISEGTVVYVALNGNCIGNIIIADLIKKDSKKAVEDLKKLGVNQIIMLTGDNKLIAEKISTTLNIDKFFAELLPQDKVFLLEKFKNQLDNSKKQIFVGDGINDAPVLKMADIGIAMGGIGSDAAIEAADIVIMNDELSKIPLAIKIAKRTKKIVWQNIFIILFIKIFAMFLGVIGVATIWEAVIADVGVAIICILNSTRALYINKKND